MANKVVKHKNGKDGKRRGNHTGTLIKRGNTYLAQWSVRGPDGKRKRISKSTHCSSIEDARAFLEKEMKNLTLDDTEKFVDKLLDAKKLIHIERQEIAEAKAAEEDAKPALAIKDGFDTFRSSKRRKDCRDRTIDGYESQYETFATWMHDYHPEVAELRKVTSAEADDFSTYLLNHKSSNTHNKYITLLAYVWNVLKEPARITDNPWERIAKKSVNMHIRRELTVEELTRVCGSLEGEMRLLFAFGIYTGLRLGDCATMDWGKIDLVRGLLTTNPHKTDKTFVRIPLHPTLAGMLSEVPEKERRGFVLPETAEVYGRNASVLTNRIQKTFRRAGIQTSSAAEDGKKARVDVGFHSLRHTFVSLSANAGVPLAVVQSIVGHSNPVMTRHYFHASDDALKGAVAAIPDVIEATGNPAQLPPPAGKDKLSAIHDEIASLADTELVELSKFVNAEIKRRSAL